MDSNDKSDYLNPNEQVNIDDQEVTMVDNENNYQQIKKPNRFETNKSYVQILNEMFPNQTSYVEEGRTGPEHKPMFRIGVHVNGLRFDGMSYTKQKARHEAARTAIQYFREHQMSSNYDNYDNRHNYDSPHFHHNFNHNYNRYQPYSRYEQRWAQPDPYSYSSSAHLSGQYYDFYCRPPLRQYESTSLYSRERPSIQQIPAQKISQAHEMTASPQKGSHPLNMGSEALSSVVEPNNLKRRNDFTVDDYNLDNFVEFNAKDGAEDEDREDKSEQVAEQIPEPKKEKIILRLMSERPVSENPVSVIHELQPNAQWVCTQLTTKRNGTKFEMRLLLPLANQCFVGTATTKKLAKSEAASKALLQLYNISVLGQIGGNPLSAENILAKNTIKILEEPLILKQDMANRVGAAVMLKCNQIWDKLTDLKKWTVLSAIVLTDDMNVDFIDVICLTSGTKCVKGDSLSMNGCALNDCHAEVLARRAFLHYIYGQIERLIDNNFEDNPDFILEKRSDGQGFRLKVNIKVNLFISTAPCGDSRVFSPKEEEGDPHPNRQTRGVLRAKIEGGEGTIPIKRDTIQTWDGILQGHQRLQFMSCSDKIAVWNVVGVQGALLSHLMEPIYLSSVVLASLFNYEHLVRALHGRLHLNFDSNCLKDLPERFVLNKCKVAKCQLKPDITRQLTKAPNYALNWIKEDDRPEVVSTETGRTHIENVVSRLAKRSLFSRFCSLMGRNTPVLPNCCLGQNIPVVYRDGKTASLDYQRAKTQCIQTFQEQNLGNWLQVPAETDLFKL